MTATRGRRCRYGGGTAGDMSATAVVGVSAYT
jgi:hypothetical protein